MSLANIRDKFPIFSQNENANLIYLDSAATTFKPESVISASRSYDREYSSNIHRGLYPLSIKASEEYEKVRDVVKNFINAKRREEIIFVKGATDGLNLLATTLSQIVPSGSETLTTIAEHHANFVPWQQVAISKKLKFGIATFNPLTVTQNELEQVIYDSVDTNTSIFALPYVTNVFGVEFQVGRLIEIAKSKNPNIITIVDACQAAAHIAIDVESLGCDFLVFSGHKVFGPTGVGILYGKYELLEKMPPYQYGGDMIEEVAIEQTLFAKIPAKFEAGTPPIASVIGLGAAIDFMASCGIGKIHNHSVDMCEYARSKLLDVLGSRIDIFMPKYLKSSTILSFNLKSCHPHDVGALLAEKNICIRVGHHCAQPLHTYLDIPSSCRASFSIYNSIAEIDSLASELKNVSDFLI